SFCLYYGHEVGHTSMESTHYDRRILQQQCPINNQLKESHQTTYLANFKSFPLTSTINNGSGLISSRKQFIVSYEEDTLVTRASSDTIDVNNR
ncbi:unnamed protein product, partial [Rotaria socialis]